MADVVTYLNAVRVQCIKEFAERDIPQRLLQHFIQFGSIPPYGNTLLGNLVQGNFIMVVRISR